MNRFLEFQILGAPPGRQPEIKRIAVIEDRLEAIHIARGFFTGRSIEGVIFEHCVFEACAMGSTKFSACEFYSCSFVGGSLANTHWESCIVESTVFRDCSLVGALMCCQWANVLMEHVALTKLTAFLGQGSPTIVDATLVEDVFQEMKRQRSLDRIDVGSE